MSAYSLDYTGIDLMVREVSDFLKTRDYDKKEILSIRLSIEEMLLKYYDAFKDIESLNCELLLSKRFGQTRVLLKIKGPSFDPYETEEEELKIFNACMQNLDNRIIWKYRNHENRLSLSVKKTKKISAVTWQLIAIVAAVVLGFLLKAFLPVEKLLPFCEAYLDPVNNAIMGLLGTVAVFFIFFSVMNGICNIGDIATFSKIGTKMFKRIIIIMLLTTVTVCAVSALIFPIASGSVGNFDTASLWQMIVSIIPVNLVEAFLSGNTLQISFLAIVFGIIILVLGESGKNLADRVLDLNSVMMAFMQRIISLLPVPIFISIFKLTLQGNISELIGIYKYPLYSLIFYIIAIIIFVLMTCIIQRLSVKTFMRKVMPVSIIAFMTASSAATITESYKVCEKKLGIDKQFLQMGWPINNTFLAVTSVIDCIVACLACAEVFHVPVTLTSLIVLGLNACLIGMAMPKIPGALITVYTLMLGILGIPSTALSMLISLQFITDRISTGTANIILHTELIRQASIVGRLDEDVLHSEA